MNKIKKFAKYIGIGIIVVLSILLFKNIEIKTPAQVESQEILIFGLSLDNLGTILTSIGLFGTAIWSIYQYLKSKKAKQQEKSAQIAKRFSEDMLYKCSLVIRVFGHSQLSNCIDALSKSNAPFEDFTTSELREITENDEFPNWYNNIKEKSNLDNIYYNLLEYKITTDEDFYKKYQTKESKKIKLHNYSTEEARALFKYDNENLPFRFGSLIDDVLNNLEYMCMNISSNVADSNYIYQSLHQTFFDTVSTLAIEISLRNNGKYSDKFYTNLIHVYNSWKKIYDKTTKKENVKKHQNVQVLTPKIKTVF